MFLSTTLIPGLSSEYSKCKSVLCISAASKSVHLQYILLECIVIRNHFKKQIDVCQRASIRKDVISLLCQSFISLDFFLGIFFQLFLLEAHHLFW